MTSFETGLIILSTIIVVLLILVVVFVIKFLVDLNNLVNNFNEIAILVKSEIQPTLTELQKTLNGVNLIIGTANKQVNTIKKTFAAVLGAGGLVACGLKNVSGGFAKGILAGLQFFRKK